MTGLPKQKSMKKQKNKNILLHVCCADCALKALKQLGNFEVTLYFSNSNIHPRSEYLARYNATKKIAEEESLELITENWSPQRWYKAIKFNTENTNLKRCKKCWKMRIEQTYRKAKQLKFSVISTTMLTSPYQNQNEIIKIGQNLSRSNIRFYKKIETSDQDNKGFYKQNYCGCAYSLKQRYEEKFLNKK